ncbi:MAG: phosphatidylglycerophosphatase A [Bacteroidia bacterium]|nr:phosphatidylglycerophosphatase A [Bacteroidia bacterium]MCX7764926.1 phosphatidylglycerophosphatase A [Bacteroidia bacterium]
MWWRKAAYVWLSGFGLGYMPFAPASWGSLIAVMVWGGLPPLDGWERLFLWLGILGVSLGSAFLAAPLSERDPRWLVADEITALVGVGVAYPLDTITALSISYVLFRFWDVVKIWPTNAAEQLPAPWGIFADDMVAGLYTTLCMYLIGL